MTGPSTNLYVGPRGKHYTIEKRLLCHFSKFAERCLEGSFSEAEANAIWLPDVDPNVFKYLRLWLKTGRLEFYGPLPWDWDPSEAELQEQTCRLLCRVHMLGERLLFQSSFLQNVVQEQLHTVLEEARVSHQFMPLTPNIVEEILSHSAPLRYDSPWAWESASLRPFVLRHLCTFELCTTVDFWDYAACFEGDGAFAADIMHFIAGELKWAVEQWEVQTGWDVDVAAKKEELAQEEGYDQWVALRPNIRRDVWLALRYISSFAGCQKTDFRAYAPCFELDGQVAAEILDCLAEELRWVAERWGVERGAEVDWAKEKQEYECETRFLERMMDKIKRRAGWS